MRKAQMLISTTAKRRQPHGDITDMTCFPSKTFVECRKQAILL